MTDDTLEMPTRCPFCGEQHECVTAVKDTNPIPEDGDITICWQCGRPAIFDSEIIDGGIRPPTPQEKRAIACDQNLQSILIAWRTRFQ